MRNKLRRIAALVGSALLAAPFAIAQQGGVTGMTVEAVPNAISVEWNAPPGVTVDYYKVYSSNESIIDNNGRYSDIIETIGDETNITIFDLQNRNFSHGDMIYVTVTAVDPEGNDTPLVEEQSAVVELPGGSTVQQAAAGKVGLENAVAENPFTVRLHFSGPIATPTGSAADHFTIAEEDSGTVVQVLSFNREGNDIILLTSPMAVRSRYKVTITESITDRDNQPIDPSKREAVFIARPNTEEEPTIPTNAEETPPDDQPALLPLPEEEPEEEPLVETTTGMESLPPEMDTTAPEDPSNLTLRKVLQNDGMYTVHASWKHSLNSAGDLAVYNVYESSDKGENFVGPTALQATVAITTISDVPPGTLTVKLTALDRIQNESKGIQEIIILPVTGPVLLVFISGLCASAVTWRRRRQS